MMMIRRIYSMNDEYAINAMVNAIIEIEKKNSKDKFSTEQVSKKNIVKEILDELDKVIKDEDTKN